MWLDAVCPQIAEFVPGLFWLCHSWLGQGMAVISYSRYPYTPTFSMYGILLQKQSWWTPCPRVSPAPELPPLVWKHLSSLCSRSLGADGNRRLIGGGDTRSPITRCPFPGTRNAFPSSGSGDAQSYPCVHPGAPPDMQSPSSLAR